MIAIIDYGMGNLRSVAKAVEAVGGEVTVTRDRGAIEAAAKIILPGVGSFGRGMANLRELGLDEVLRRQVTQEKKWFLGICLGMQLLARRSFEFGEHEGLGLLDAEVVRFEGRDDSGRLLRIPHVGWNDITVKKSLPVFSRVRSGDTFYFVHSYHMRNHDPTDVAATCGYGEEFTAAVARKNLLATQFHPEKSQDNGLNLLADFVDLPAAYAAPAVVGEGEAPC